MTAARLIRTARLRAGLSQRGLSIATGVPQSTVARIERGTILPRTDTLERLLRGAGQTLSAEPRAGLGVDRSLIRMMLRRTPAERVRSLRTEALALQKLDRAFAGRRG